MQGGMLHARQKSQSPPCSAKAGGIGGGGGGGGIGRYRSASFMEDEFKAPHHPCTVLLLSDKKCRSCVYDQQLHKCFERLSRDGQQSPGRWMT